MALFGLPLSGVESALTSTLPGLMRGTGPSAARGQLYEGLGQAQRNAASLAASDRSNPALAMRNALLANQEMAQRTNQQAATLRAQEQLGSMGLGAQVGDMRSQDFLGQLGNVGRLGLNAYRAFAGGQNQGKAAAAGGIGSLSSALLGRGAAPAQAGGAARGIANAAGSIAMPQAPRQATMQIEPIVIEGRRSEMGMAPQAPRASTMQIEPTVIEGRRSEMGTAPQEIRPLPMWREPGPIVAGSGLGMGTDGRAAGPIAPGSGLETAIVPREIQSSMLQPQLVSQGPGYMNFEFPEQTAARLAMRQGPAGQGVARSAARIERPNPLAEPSQPELISQGPGYMNFDFPEQAKARMEAQGPQPVLASEGPGYMNFEYPDQTKARNVPQLAYQTDGYMNFDMPENIPRLVSQGPGYMRFGFPSDYSGPGRRSPAGEAAMTDEFLNRIGEASLQRPAPQQGRVAGAVRGGVRGANTRRDYGQLGATGYYEMMRALLNAGVLPRAGG